MVRDDYRHRLSTLVVVDSVTHSSAETIELVIDCDAAERAIGRAPDVHTDRLTSWGDLSPTEIARLLEVATDEDLAEFVARARQPHRECFISIFCTADP